VLVATARASGGGRLRADQPLQLVLDVAAVVAWAGPPSDAAVPLLVLVVAVFCRLR
jgi:hypothetical protein